MPSYAGTTSTPLNRDGTIASDATLAATPAATTAATVVATAAAAKEGWEVASYL